jgi:DNA-binding IclR family transcriptional regulator
VTQKAAPAKPTETKKLNAIEKALEIMLKFQDIKASWGIRELSGELGFSPATVQRILTVLKSYGFVRQDARTRQYFVGNIFYRFLENLNHSNNLTGIGRPFLEELARQTHETVYLNVIQGNLRICIDSIESTRVLKPEIRTRDKTHFSYCINVLMDAARAFSRAMGQSVTHHNPIPQHM